MNSRIMELYKEATGESFVSEFDTSFIRAEKFAELIVRECANIAYNFGEPFEDGPGTKISDKIQEHFGVE